MQPKEKHDAGNETKTHTTLCFRPLFEKSIMDNGVLVEIRVREKAGEEPLSSKDQKTAEEFIRKYSKNIITKWIKFFVLRQAVKSTTIKTKL